MQKQADEFVALIIPFCAIFFNFTSKGSMGSSAVVVRLWSGNRAETRFLLKNRRFHVFLDCEVLFLIRL